MSGPARSGDDARIPVRREPGAYALERETTPVRIAAVLRAEIAKGALRPGARLHEVEYTAAFGVSRHTFREATALLVGEGLLTRTSFKGVEVTKLSADEVRDIYAARRLIELSAVDRLATSAHEVTDAVLAAADALASLPAATDGQILNKADIAVHVALVAAHESRRISASFMALLTEIQILLFGGYDAEDIAPTIANHAEFAALVRAQRFEAARIQLEGRLREAEARFVR